MRLLLVHTGFLGDLVLATPVIGALKGLHPHAKLWILTTKAGYELLKPDPLVEDVLVFDKRGKHRGLGGLIRCAREISGHAFDKAFSLHRSARTSLLLRLAAIPERIGFRESSASFFYTKTKRTNPRSHAVQRNLGIVGEESKKFDEVLSHVENTTANPDILHPDTLGELRLSGRQAEEASQEVTDRLYTANPESRKMVVIAPGSVWATKRWPSKRFREVALALAALGYRIVLLGDKHDIEAGNEVGEAIPVVNLVGKTTLSDAIFVVERASLVICNDSFIGHVAAARKIPTVVIFCATSPSYGFGPWRNRSVMIERGDLFCKPCSRHGGDTCPTGTSLCMNGVPSQSVLDAALALIDGKTAANDYVSLTA